MTFKTYSSAIITSSTGTETIAVDAKHDEFTIQVSVTAPAAGTLTVQGSLAGAAGFANILNGSTSIDLSNAETIQFLVRGNYNAIKITATGFTGTNFQVFITSDG